MKQRISQWPVLNAHIPPELWARIEEQSEQRALPMSVIIREALARGFETK